MTDDEGLERIERALRGLGSQHVPSAGWEAGVLAATVGSSHRKWVWRIALVGAPVAAAVAILLFIRPSRAEPIKVHLAKIESSGPAVQVRGDDLQLGNVVQATASGGDHRALWIYRSGDLVLGCPGHPSCRETADELTVPMELEEIGAYVIVALSDDEPLEPPKGKFDSDIARALEVGATDDRYEFRID